MRNPFAVARDVRPSASRGGSSFEGAGHGRFPMDWALASIRSADQEVRYDLRTLRANSRELVRNNDLASRYVNLVDEQAIGHEGIRLQATVKRPNGLMDIGINHRIEDAWHEWCEPENCTLDGRNGFVDVLSHIAQGVPKDGEFLCQMLPWEGNRFGFALHLLDPDQLEAEHNREAGTGRAQIRMGVEVNPAGRPLRYHVWDSHPTEYSGRGRQLRALPAEQVIHLYRQNRIAQTRGVPWMHPALQKLQMLSGYEEAELVASRVAAAKGGWFTSTPEGTNPADPNSPAVAQQFSFEIEPGVFDRLPIGWGFKEWDPQHPTTAFPDFHKAMVRGIANGLNVAYTSLANDLEGVNFSSIRAGLLNERDAWRKLQNWIIRHFCRRVYRGWLRWSLTTGALDLPERNVTRWHRHRWQPRGWPWVDPVKDATAAAMEVRLGVNSRTRIAAERGRDLEEVFSDLVAEEQLAAQLGLVLSTDVSRAGGSDTDDDDDTPPGKPPAANRIAQLASTNGRHR